MSRPSLAIELPTDTLHIVRWDDPVLDAIGHDPRSAYVERFWLSLLGPSTCDVSPYEGLNVHFRRLTGDWRNVSSVHEAVTGLRGWHPP